jgi:hypothetical protein
MPGYDVITNHQLLAFGDNLVQVFDSTSGEVLATATRADIGSDWTVHAVQNPNSVPDETVPADPTDTPRSSLVDVLSDLVYRALGPNSNPAVPGDGYSMMVPTGFRELP